MRLLDEKGRLFGSINIIDAVIIFIVLLVVAGAAYKFLHTAEEISPTTIDFTVRVPGVIPESAGVLRANDRMVAGTDYVPITVTSVSIEPALTTETDANGQKVLTCDPHFKDIIVTLRGSTPISNAQIKLSTQDIRVGRDYWIKSRTYEFKGTITKVTLNPLPDKSKR